MAVSRQAHPDGREETLGRRRGPPPLSVLTGGRCPSRAPGVRHRVVGGGRAAPFVPQRFDRHEPRRLARRVEAEEHADDRGESEREADRAHARISVRHPANARPRPTRSPRARCHTSEPITRSVTASTRNCVRMSRARAPTASRSPISRVRSVTDTSMMFMMPMPPTTSDTEATAASSRPKTSARFRACLHHLGHVLDRERIVWPCTRWPLPQNRRDLLLTHFVQATVRGRSPGSRRPRRQAC